MPGVVAAANNRPGFLSLLLGAGLNAYGANMTNKDTARANIAVADTTAKNLKIDDQIGWYNSAQTEGNKLLNIKAAYVKAADDAARQKLSEQANIVRDGFLASNAYSRMSRPEQENWMKTFGPDAQYQITDGTMSATPIYGGQQYGMYGDTIKGLEDEKKQNNLQMIKEKSPMGGLFTSLVPALGTILTNRAIGPVYPRTY